MGRERLVDKSKVSITRLSKYFCVTVPAAKKILAEAGYLNQEGKPNPEAISSGAAEKRTAEDGNTYLVWHFGSVKQHFKEPSDADISCFFKNRYDLEDKILSALSEMGHLVRSDDAILTPEEIDIIDECDFRDPHFIGGPGAFHFADTKAKVNAIFDKLDAHFESLAAKCKGGSNDPRLNIFRETLKAGRGWLIKQVSRR